MALYCSLVCKYVNKDKRIPKGQSKMDNLEKLARRRKTKKKHNTICVRHYHT